MKRLTTALLMLAASAISSNTWAATTVYESDPMENNSYGFNFPGLDLQKATATLSFSTTEISPEPTLSRLTLDFEFAKDLVVTGFTYSPQTNSYIARTNKGWIFKELLVEVITDPNRNDAEIRIAVPEFVSTLNNTELTPGVDLFTSMSPIF